MSAAGIRMGTPTGRAVIAAAVLGSGMTWLDGSVVNVALRTIGDDLGRYGHHAPAPEPGLPLP